MLVLYDVGASNLGQALATAQQRALEDRWAHISLFSHHRSGSGWTVVFESPGNNGPLSEG